MKKVPVIFLDRDGVINAYPGDRDYVKSWKEFHFLPLVFEALRNLQERGFEFFVISNQAGVSKGIYAQAALDEISANMLQRFKSEAVGLQQVYYCIHTAEDACPCRKPKTGLLDKAAQFLAGSGLAIDLARSYFIGDSMIDVEAGKNFGLKTILVLSGKKIPDQRQLDKTPPDYTAKDLYEAAAIIAAKNVKLKAQS